MIRPYLPGGSQNATNTADSHGGKPSPRLRKRFRTLATTAVALIAVSLIGYNAALGIFIVTVLLGILGLVSSAIPLDGYRLESIPWRLGLVATSLILFATPPLAISFHNLTLENRLLPIVTAIEAYRTATGRYPQSLGQLVPVYVDSIPDCPYHELRYRIGKNRGSEEFSLSCITFGFNKHDFESATQSWVDWD